MGTLYKFPISDILFIKKYPEIATSRNGLLYGLGQLML